MQTVQWGKAMWTPLHAITFNYPIKPTQDDKQRYKNYFNIIHLILLGINFFPIIVTKRFSNLIKVLYFFRLSCRYKLLTDE